MSKLPQSQKGKEKIAFWLLNPASRIESLLLCLLFLLLPTQLGKHFWPDFSIVSGIRIDYLSPTLYITDILLSFLFVAVLVRWIKDFRISKLKSQILKLQLKSKILISLVFLLFLLNSIFAMHPLLSFYGLAKIGECTFLVLYLAKIIRSQLQLQQFSFLFAISALFESLLAIFQYLHQGSLNGIFYIFGERTFTGVTPGIANASIGGVLILRPYATFPHPNVLAGYLLIAMTLVWSFVLSSHERWKKGVAILTLLMGSVALLLTLSRIVILIWGVLLLFILLRSLIRSAKTKRAKLIALFVTVLALVVIGTVPVSHEIITRFSQTSLFEESVTERTELLTASLKMMQQHPFFGVGLSNFIPTLAPLQKPLPLGLYLQPVHNIFVLVATQTGIVGVGLFMWLLTATFLGIKKQEVRIKNTLFVLFAIILVTGTFDHYWLTLQQGQLLFATVLGLSFAQYRNK